MLRTPPAAGAVVMGTGIVSIGLSLDGHRLLAHVLLGLAALMWTVLALVVLERLRLDRAGIRRDARSPGALTGVAGTAVLGTATTELGWAWAGVALLAIALALLLTLLKPLLKPMVEARTAPTTGASFLASVSITSLAVLCATLGAIEQSDWLIAASLVPFAVGVVSYLGVLVRFDFRELLIAPGDHWITGGALAISSLAAGRVFLSATRHHALPAFTSGLEACALVLWLLALCWLPVLVAAEVLRPRLGYELRRWSTVFPMGMYAVCSLAVGAELHHQAITRFGRVWLWLAVPIWLLAFTGLTRRLGRSRVRD
jgi:tellurite resistance protein TehA-like permease